MRDVQACAVHASVWRAERGREVDDCKGYVGGAEEDWGSVG